MVKTSTPLNVSNFAAESTTEKVEDSLDTTNELFLNSLKWQLDDLKREPSSTTIQSILDYAKAK